MRTLYLDTSSSYLVAGISNNRSLIGEVKLKLDKKLSSFALMEIESLFSKCGLKPSDIDKILVVNGPGSFTGIRIGITIAKVYAWTLKKEISTISSLEAMACSSVGNSDYIVPVIDARRDYVYGAIFKADGKSKVLVEQYVKKSVLEAAIEDLPGKVIVVTNDQVEFKKEVVLLQVDIEKIIDCYENKPSMNPHAIEPDYLKKTEAEENRSC